MADFWFEEKGNDRTAGKSNNRRTPSSYIHEAKAYIRKNNWQEAYAILQAAWVMYPDNPFVLSYYGSFHAVVGKKFRAGIEHCTKAISLVVGKSPVDEYFFLSELYLNLGRAYRAADMRKEAIHAFHKGLRYEKNNIDILKELQACERRARPAVPFLDRSNPINKYAGLARRRGPARKG